MESRILCCLCGTSIVPNDAAMCIECLTSQFDISDCIEKNEELVRCKKCDRWMATRDHWQSFEMESQVLLSFCLRKVKGLAKVKLIDARFIWTEPHSLRIKIEIDIERGVMDEKVKLRQKVVIEFIIKNKQCHDCIREATDHTWGALLQVRQRVIHKSVLCALESSLIKAGLQDLMINVQIVKEGMDIFFKAKNQCDRVVEFISSQMPTSKKTSKKLVSRDQKSNTAKYEYTTVLEIVPLCKGDVVLTPKSLTGTAELMIVSKLSSSLHLINPLTLCSTEVTASKYFAKPFPSILSVKSLVTFVVLDIAPLESAYPNTSIAKTHTARDLAKKPKNLQAPDTSASTSTSASMRGLPTGQALAEAEVTRETDFGQSCRVVTHLGHILQPGDFVLGYDLAHSVTDEAVFVGLPYDVPDVILVRKSYVDKKKGIRSRASRGANAQGGKRRGRAAGGGRHPEDVDSAAAVMVGRLPVPAAEGELGADLGLLPTVDLEAEQERNFEGFLTGDVDLADLIAYREQIADDRGLLEELESMGFDDGAEIHLISSDLESLHHHQPLSASGRAGNDKLEVGEHDWNSTAGYSGGKVEEDWDCDRKDIQSSDYVSSSSSSQQLLLPSAVTQGDPSGHRVGVDQVDATQALPPRP